jgi:hypothetical protein
MRRGIVPLAIVLFTLSLLTCASGQENVLKNDNQKDTTPGITDTQKSTPGSPTKEETFIDNYIEHLVYMVYIDEKVKIPEGEEGIYRKAISAANDYLASKSIEVVLLDQVEKLKKDHTTMVEVTQGENVSVVQWLAQKLNSDVYIVIDVMVKSEKRGAQFFAQANITLTVFEAATGRLLGSKSYSQLDKSVGNSEELAKTSAVQISVSRIMGEVIELTKTYMRKAVANGIRYEFFLVGTQDAKTVLYFIGKLKEEKDVIKNVESVYRSDTEGKYYVYYFGKPEDFELLIYNIAETVPGLGGMKLISQRGKSFTFTTGI